MKTVFLYAGQGSQRVGMGEDFYEKYETYRKVVDEQQLSFDVKTLMHRGDPEQLSDTRYTQPAMATFAAGVTEVLKENGITPDAAAGLSLGEYGALYAADVMDAKTYVKITEIRGAAMADAAEGIACSMSAVLGSTPEVIEEACCACQDSGFVTVANYNCPGQAVICGEENAVAATEEYLKEKGVRRFVRLKVSGPFHTKFMAPAAEKLKVCLEASDLKKPQIPVAMNVTGDFYKEEESLVELLEKQIQTSVHFEDDLVTLMKSGATNFIEIGPGNALSGFVKKTAKALDLDVTIHTIDKVEDLEELIHG